MSALVVFQSLSQKRTLGLYGIIGGYLFLHKSHAREPLYSKSAVIAWWSQSTSGKNVHLAVEKGNKFLNISLLRVFFADYCQ